MGQAVSPKISVVTNTLCTKIFHKNIQKVHRLLAVTHRKLLHPQNSARRLRRRLTLPNGTYETARKLVLCSRPCAPAPPWRAPRPDPSLEHPSFSHFYIKRGVLGGLTDAIPRFIQKSYTDFARPGTERARSVPGSDIFHIVWG